ncbi:GGDEF domain-containing protein [Marinobacterium sp. AK62]|uniref:diguanylate cyclase n=1 Tax=Marinobacterium alkalitolerans TaxID=1542925 RepID=A0ABS3Z7H0_9GAMM|nr:GGDEF domain-containing protein [Marinobacterium alkalitolerans]MBP0047265.1 GGDEF domain-containing protein [Marinobacterium alkalitolerans]
MRFLRQGHRPPIIAVLALLASFCLLFGARLGAEPVQLDQNWEYRWGDSPFVNDVPAWTLEPAPDAWHSIDFPSNPPDRNDRQNVWYRTVLPEGNLNDPVMYIFSVDLIVEVYLEGERIYHYGEFDEQGQGTFQGWPWHMIPLPQNAAGKPIYFRIFSNYLDIGLWGEVKIMERMKLYQQVLQQSFDGLTITAFSLLIGLLCLLFALLNAERKNLLALALFSVCNAGLALSGSQAKQLILNQPLMWDYVEAGSYYLLPIALLMLLRSWYGPHHRRLFNLLMLVFGSYFSAAMLLSAIGLTSVANTYPPFDLLFTLCIPPMLFVVTRQWRNATPDQRTLLLATGLLTALLLWDMAVAHNWAPWMDVPVGWGSLVFAFALIALSVHHFNRTRRALSQLTLSLEERVNDRTRELEKMALQDARRVKALEFGNRKRGTLDELVASMESTGDIHQALQCLSDQIRGLCSPVPGAYYLQDNNDYQLHRVAQWDSEEHLPEQLDPASFKAPSQHWKRFPIHYDTPGDEGVQTGMLWLNLDPDIGLFDNLSPYTLEILFTRGIERINLTLSKVALQQALSRFSYEDALTGVHNRRYLDQMLEHELARGARNQSDISLVICDIDHFKRLNDSFGHAAGDKVLQQVAQQLISTFRSSDIICRYGGEEFVIVMPDTRLEDAKARAEQLRTTVEAADFHFNNLPIGPVTLSAGLSTGQAGSVSAETLLRQADKALYEAKNAGRNRVIYFEDPATQRDPATQTWSP